MKHRSFIVFGEPLAVLSPWGQIASSRVVLWTSVGRPRSLSCILLGAWSPRFGSTPLSTRPLSRHSNSRSACARRRFRRLFSLASCHRPMFSMSGERCIIGDVQICSLCFVMAMYEITTHTPRVFTVFFFRKCVFLLLFHLAQGFAKRAFRHVCVEWLLIRLVIVNGARFKRKPCQTRSCSGTGLPPALGKGFLLA